MGHLHLDIIRCWHREIIEDVENKFATLNSVKDLKEQVGDMKEKIDRIYECIIAVK